MERWNGRVSDRRSGWTRATIATAAMASVLAFATQWSLAAPPLAEHSFEEALHGWKVESSNGATVERATKTEEVKTGKGALAMRYVVESGQFSFLVLEAGGVPMAEMKALRFAIRTDRDTPMAVAVEEKDGGHYHSLFWSPKNAWQAPVVSLADFTLSTGKDDPADPNGKLDPERIERIIVMDLANLFIQDSGGGLISVEKGPRRLWMDDFRIVPDAPVVAAPKGDEMILEDFAGDVLRWIPIGTTAMAVDAGEKTLKGRALRVDYRQEQGKLTVVARGVPANLAPYRRLAFSAASEREMGLVVSLEEKNKSRYIAIVEIPGESKEKALSIPFAGFTRADDSPRDPNGKLDLDSIATISFADLSFMTATTPAANTLRIGVLRAVK